VGQARKIGVILRAKSCVYKRERQQYGVQVAGDNSNHYQPDSLEKTNRKSPALFAGAGLQTSTNSNIY
jgi:hypothetical protein